MAMNRLILGAVLSLAIPPPLAAQEKGQVGINVSAGASAFSLGGTYHVSGRFALRPSVQFLRQTVEDDLPSLDGARARTREDKTTLLGAGIGLGYYFPPKDSLSPYLAATFALARERNTVTPVPTGQAPDARNDRHTRQVGALFGLHYKAAKRLALYGEAGVRYSWSSVSGSLHTGLGDVTSLTSLTTGLGVIFYLK